MNAIPPPKKDLAPAHDNQPLGNSKCSGCHDPHSSNIAKAPAGVFSRSLQGEVVFRLPSCAGERRGSVDSPENSKVQLTAAAVDLLCYECHAHFKEEMEGTKSRHKLLSQSNRSCMECHDPHAANQEYVLKKPAQDLCLSCHVATPNKTDQPDGSMPSPEAVNTSCDLMIKMPSILSCLPSMYMSRPGNRAFCATTLMALSFRRSCARPCATSAWTATARIRKR